MNEEEKKDIEELEKQDRKLFLENLKNGKIIIADVEKTDKGTKYYYITKIC